MHKETPHRYWRGVLRTRFTEAVGDQPSAEDVIDELAQHLEIAEMELRGRGLGASEARAKLECELDDDAFVSAVLRRARTSNQSSIALTAIDTSISPASLTSRVREWVAESMRDLAFGIRSLARERAFAAFVITTLALGIGANAAMFGILDRLLFRGPLHVRDARQVRRIVSTTEPPGGRPQRTGYFGYVAYETFRADTQTFAGVAAYNFLPTGAMFGQGESARPIPSGTATAGFFPLLGVGPALGRFFDQREDDLDRPQNVVVLGYGFWQSEFAGDRNIVGRTIQVDYRPHTVIGVAPRGFTGVDLMRVDVWRPESGAPHSTNWRRTWNAPWLHIVARLRPGVSPERAGAALTSMYRRGYVGRDSVRAKAMITAEPTHYTYAGVEATEARVSRWLFGVAAVVLLVTCANVVNLLLARIMKRRRELAVRIALGAGRSRLIRLLVLEALVLTTVGGAAGLAVAAALGVSARALIEHVEWVVPVVDTRVLWATLGFSLFTCLLVGLLPALHGSKVQLNDLLKSGAREGGGRTAWFRTALTISQAALSVVLLVGAGLFVQSLRHARAADLGIETSRVLTLEVERWGVGRNPDTVAQRIERERRAAFLPMMVERLRARPDVERVSIAGGIPFEIVSALTIKVPGRDSIPAQAGGGPFVMAVSSDYFATVGTRVLRGRAFTPADRKGSAPVAVINETLARNLWPGETGLGKCIVVAEATSCAEIVGIAADTKQSSLRDEDAIQVYVPLNQREFGARERLVVRPRGEPADVLAAIRRELMRLDATILFVRTDFLQHEVDRQMRPWRLGATIFTLFGGLALVVAAVGLYSVMSYLLTQRVREIGIRLALGARAADVARLVIGNGMRLAVIGIAIGAVGAFAGSRALAPLLFNTSPRDPLVFGSVLIGIALVALFAAGVPGLRASRVDPMEAIRGD